MTHLSDVSEPDKSYAEMQVERFKMVVGRLGQRGSRYLSRTRPGAPP